VESPTHRSAAHRYSAVAARFAALPAPILFLLFFAAVALSHLTLLHLPYYWDEGGYYIPAALDFYHTGQLIPHFTNAHPPLPNILLGTLWHIVGYRILATRLFVCAFAAAALLAIFRLTQRLLDATAAIAVTLLTAVYPIWFAQSTLAHADIFAAAFTLWAFALYLPQQENPGLRRYLSVAALFSLAALSKETAILQPAALAALQAVQLLRDRRSPQLRRQHLSWLSALAFPALPLIAWFAYHHHSTGFTFGNPEYLRYNATANLTAAHILQAIRYRFLHLFWQRNIWIPILLALACLFLPRRASASNTLSPRTLRIIALLIAANWFAFSILGGALLTRYLLPMYPLILIVCVDLWRTHTSRWPIFAAVTAAAFVSALWVNPPTSFAPEDNLTYRDMIVVQQEAIDFVAQHYPDATILTAWPVAADVFRPELGYVSRPLKATSIDDFTLPEVRKAAQEPGRYDTAIVFTAHFLAPSFRRYLLDHPDSRRGREFAATRDLTPTEIAAILGGRIVWQDDRNGEWAAVLRFDRSYDARLLPPR
jgi:4-amino-4-deoxy-L-arabinose transferase-like glycosyltransferase